ncbi:MAG TPA: S8 family serine peptidase, partial [Ramlibacter sp.]|nr:S8 family serine peptidase [Ramlibacter sp.]
MLTVLFFSCLLLGLAAAADAPTQRVIVELDEPATLAEIEELTGYRLVERINPKLNLYVLERPWPEPDGRGSFSRDVAEGHSAIRQRVAYFEELVPKERRHRSVLTTDRLWPREWYMFGRMLSGAAVRTHLNVQGAWDRGATGRDINIRVVDDGIDPHHRDLAAAFDAAHSYGVGGSSYLPDRPDNHGTKAASVAAARHDPANACGVGVAPEAKVAGINLLSRFPDDAHEAVALGTDCDVAETDAPIIFSNSWGPRDDNRRHDGPGRATRDVLRHCAVNERSLFFWAGGNGQRYGDDGNNDGYANSIWTFTVGAVTDLEAVAWYSESCACLDAVAPSSGGSAAGGVVA